MFPLPEKWHTDAISPATPLVISIAGKNTLAQIKTVIKQVKHYKQIEAYHTIGGAEAVTGGWYSGGCAMMIETSSISTPYDSNIKLDSCQTQHKCCKDS